MNASLAESMIRAASLEIGGKTEEAVAELCRAREAGHQSSTLFSAIGHLQFELRYFQEAAGSYEEALRLDRDDATTHYNRAVCLEKLGAWEDAAAAFQKSIDLDSRRAGAYLGLGISRLHLDRPQEALDAFERCLERQPFRDAALRGQAVALHVLGRLQEASEAYRKLLSRDPLSEELLSNTISLAISSGEYELLAHCSGRLLEIQADSPVALEGAALAAFARRDFDGALRFSTALVEAHPGHVAGWFNCGVALQKTAQYGKAAEAYARAASLDPQSAETFLNLGTVLQEIDRWEDARGAYETALALRPGLRMALWNLGLLNEARNNLRGAEDLYFRLVTHHADAQDGWFRLGYVRLQLADYPGCVTAFEACLGFARKCPEAQLNLGIAYWRMNNLGQAQETFRQLSDSPVESAEALRCLASMALQHHDYEEALKLYKRLVEVEKPSSDQLYNLALLLQKRGRPAEAVRHYRQALALRPDFRQALLNLGHALMALGRHEEAQATWQTALLGNVELAEQFLV